MHSFFTIEVRRMSDHVVVAYTSEKAIHSHRDQTIAKCEARRLSSHFGPRFFVELWSHYSFDGGEDYHRVCVMYNGHVGASVGW